MRLNLPDEVEHSNTSTLNRTLVIWVPCYYQITDVEKIEQKVALLEAKNAQFVQELVEQQTLIARMKRHIEEQEKLRGHQCQKVISNLSDSVEICDWTRILDVERIFNCLVPIWPVFISCPINSLCSALYSSWIERNSANSCLNLEPESLGRFPLHFPTSLHPFSCWKIAVK